MLAGWGVGLLKSLPDAARSWVVPAQNKSQPIAQTALCRPFHQLRVAVENIACGRFGKERKGQQGMTHTQPASVRPGRRYNNCDRRSADDLFHRQLCRRLADEAGLPRWAGHLQLGEAELRSIDCNVPAPPEVCRNILRSLQADRLSLGALLTTPKLNLLPSCRDMFSSLDPDVATGGQVSSISKREGKLVGHARESLASFSAPGGISSSGALAENRSGGVGSGVGFSAMAFTFAVMDARNERNRPSRIVVTDREKSQLQAMHKVHKKSCAGVPTEYHCITSAADNDALLNALSPGSLVINATGLGRDLPGSPITEKASFPEGGYAWDFNFQVSLPFLDQARSQQPSGKLQVEDGLAVLRSPVAACSRDVFAVEFSVPGGCLPNF